MSISGAIIKFVRFADQCLALITANQQDLIAIINNLVTIRAGAAMVIDGGMQIYRGISSISPVLYRAYLYIRRSER